MTVEGLGPRPGIKLRAEMNGTQHQWTAPRRWRSQQREPAVLSTRADSALKRFQNVGDHMLRRVWNLRRDETQNDKQDGQREED